jgi:hypothetical protein
MVPFIHLLLGQPILFEFFFFGEKDGGIEPSKAEMVVRSGGRESSGLSGTVIVPNQCWQIR